MARQTETNESASCMGAPAGAGQASISGVDDAGQTEDRGYARLIPPYALSDLTLRRYRQNGLGG